MSSSDAREKFIEFFKEKGHRLVPPSSLVPENDPSVLFTTAGMQQFKGFYLKPELAPSSRIITIQPCLRTSDIDEVGDNSHLTLFEMVGNFSFGYSNKGGSYFKQEAIGWAWEFLTGEKWLGLSKNNFSATYFGGTDNLAKDHQSEEILKKLDGLEKVEPAGQEDNFWGPTGLEGPCGPTVEFHFRGLEVWNLVFNEYYFANNQYRDLEYKGVDTGAGLERLAVVINSLENVYETDLFVPLIGVIENNGITDKKNQRIIADHIKAVVFTLADGVVPSNKDAGYVVRRLVRKIMTIAGDRSGDLIESLRAKVVDIYGSGYPHLIKADFGSIAEEVKKWAPVMERGKKIIRGWVAKGEKITGKMAFDLYQSHGFPIELTRDMAREGGIQIDEKGFWRELEHHKEISRAGVEGKFKGGLAGHSVIEIRYHTAAHLLLAALREVVGEKVYQRGANINTERLRFDFSCDHQLSAAELVQIEAIVNEKINQNMPVTCREMTKEEAGAKGIIGTFKDRYGDKVKIYFIGDCEKPFSAEFCGGPHVKSTGEIGAIKIIKEESAGAGVRRIRAKLE